MRIRYDPEVDALYVRLVDDTIIESEEVRPGIVLDFNEAGQVVGVEVLGVRKQVPAEDLERVQEALA